MEVLIDARKGAEGTRSSELSKLDTEKLKSEFSNISTALSEIFDQKIEFGSLSVAEVQIQLEISASGGFSLIANGKASVAGAIKVTLKKE